MLTASCPVRQRQHTQSSIHTAKKIDGRQALRRSSCAPCTLQTALAAQRHKSKNKKARQRAPPHHAAHRHQRRAGGACSEGARAWCGERSDGLCLRRLATCALLLLLNCCCCWRCPTAHRTGGGPRRKCVISASRSTGAFGRRAASRTFRGL
jgi:hypothetical protein